MDWYIQWFEEYIQRFSTDDPFAADMIRHKRRHSLRVLANARSILRDEGADGATGKVVEIAALLHDVGRFPQIVGHGTMDDFHSVNHGRAGALVLLREQILAGLTRRQRKIIICTTNYHNRGWLPANLYGDCRFVLDVVRDADKMDIVPYNTRLIDSETDFSKLVREGVRWHPEKYTDYVVDCILTRETIDYSRMRWSSDFTLLLCSWIYDLNFNWSRRTYLAKGYLESLLGKLGENGRLPEAKERLRSDLCSLAREEVPS